MVKIKVLLVAPLTMEALFDAKYLAIIEQGEMHILEKMDQLKTELDVTHALISELIAEIEQENVLQKQIDQVLTISDAIRTNSSKDRHYFLALINTIREEINNLLTDATLDEEKAIAYQLQQRIRNDEFDETNDLGFLSLSKIFAEPAIHAGGWVSSTIRSFMPKILLQAVDETLHKYIPSTYDGESMDLLTALTTARLKALNATLQTRHENRDRLVNALADNNLVIKPLILAATQTRLEQMLTTNQTVYQVITDYRTFGIQVLNHQAMLQAAKGLDKEIDAFLFAHDGFIVWLSLVLSKKISSLFKTDASAKVEEIRVMKNTLHTMKISYETRLDSDKAEIIANPNIAPAIKKAFIAKLSPKLGEIAPDSEPKALKPANMVTTFNLIHTMFNHLSPVESSIDIKTRVTMAAS